MSKFMDQNGVEHFTQTLINSTKTIDNKSIWGTGNIDLGSAILIPVNGYPWMDGTSSATLQDALSYWFNETDAFGSQYTNNFAGVFSNIESKNIVIVCTHTTNMTTIMNATTYIIPYLARASESGNMRILTLDCYVRGIKYDSAQKKFTDNYEGTAEIIITASDNVVAGVMYRFTETVDPNKWTEVEVNYDLIGGSALSSNYINLSTENTRVYFNCKFKINMCPANTVTYQIKVPKSNPLDHYRIHIAARSSSFGDCSTTGKFIDILGDQYTTGSDTYGVLFSLPQTRMSGTGYVGATNTLSTYSRFAWGKCTNNFNGIIIDLYKQDTVYPVSGSVSLNGIYYIGVVQAINSEIKFTSGYKYPSA